MKIGELAREVGVSTDTSVGEPDGAKTLFTVHRPKPSSAKDRAKLEEMATFLVHAYGDGLAMLAPMIKADVAARSAAGPEPELPVSAGRNLTDQA